MLYDAQAHARAMKLIYESAGPGREFSASTLCRAASHIVAIRKELEAATGFWHLNSGPIGRYLAAAAGVVTADGLQVKRRVAHKTGIYRVVRQQNEREGDARVLRAIHKAKGLHEFSAAELCRDAGDGRTIRAALELVGIIRPTRIGVGRYLSRLTIGVDGLRMNMRRDNGHTRYWLTEVSNPETQNVIGQVPLSAAQPVAGETQHSHIP